MNKKYNLYEKYEINGNGYVYNIKWGIWIWDLTCIRNSSLNSSNDTMLSCRRV